MGAQPTVSSIIISKTQTKNKLSPFGDSFIFSLLVTLKYNINEEGYNITIWKTIL